MLKLIGPLVLALALLAACGGDSADKTAAVEVTIVEFNANPSEFTGKTLIIAGTVDHVCKHGGKRMFLMGDEPTDRVKIEGGPAAPFDVALEGSDLIVTGVGQVLKVDDAYLDNWEAELSAEEPTEGDEGQGEEHHGDTLAQITSLRQQLADSGDEYVGFYTIECNSFEEVKTP